MQVPHRTFLIDVREGCRKNRTGKGQWTYGFVSELLKRMPLTLVTDDELPEEWKRSPNALAHRVPGSGLRWHWNILRWLRTLPGHPTYVSPVSYIVPAFAPRHVQCVPVVHDVIAFQEEPHERKAKLIERLLLPRVLRRCPRICVISDATKHDVLLRFPEITPERIVPIFAGPWHSHPGRKMLDNKTVVSIGTLCPRKNQLRLIQAFAQLPEDLRQSYRLVLAGGRGWDDAQIIEAARATEGVEWRGYVGPQEYESLLYSCTVFALPSLYEGFGMQILDALQCGIPVLTSNRGNLRELAEGAALIVDPEDVDSIAAGLERLLHDDGLRAELRQKALQRAEIFSWRRTVDLFLDSL